jgi:hypothetical protein
MLEQINLQEIVDIFFYMCPAQEKIKIQHYKLGNTHIIT